MPGPQTWFLSCPHQSLWGQEILRQPSESALGNSEKTFLLQSSFGVEKAAIRIEQHCTVQTVPLLFQLLSRSRTTRARYKGQDCHPPGHLTTPHLTTPHHTPPYHTTLYHYTHHTTPNHITLGPTTPHYTTPHHTHHTPVSLTLRTLLWKVIGTNVIEQQEP